MEDNFSMDLGGEVGDALRRIQAYRTDCAPMRT